MEQSALPKSDTAWPEVSKCKELEHATGASGETNRIESEVLQGNPTNVGGTKMEQRLKYVEDKLREMNAQFEGAEHRLQVLQERLSQEAANGIDGSSSRSQEAINNNHSFALNPGLDPVLASTIGHQKVSGTVNDPCQESAVLEMYDRLRTHEWEKAKCAASGSAFPMMYEQISPVIKAVFATCEEELSQRMDRIFEALEIPVSKETKSIFATQQLTPGLTREIRNHLKHLYSNRGEDFFQARSRPLLPPDLQTFQPLVHFTAECDKIYCLLLLQSQPIIAVWGTEGRTPTSCIEHVDNKDVEDETPFSFLWPVLVCGGNVLRKGVIYG
ncbi:uncharacterized protein LOC142007317 [Carettochelys insculpta]|uniref:uncharacterized protein LOC142007317 n=1 Tax=Carettochelys insculpta TaxID=44489 RepID=UPI003EBBFE75